MHRDLDVGPGQRTQHRDRLPPTTRRPREQLGQTQRDRNRGRGERTQDLQRLPPTTRRPHEQLGQTQRDRSRGRGERTQDLQRLPPTARLLVDQAGQPHRDLGVGRGERTHDLDSLPAAPRVGRKRGCGGQHEAPDAIRMALDPGAQKADGLCALSRGHQRRDRGGGGHHPAPPRHLGEAPEFRDLVDGGPDRRHYEAER